MSGTRTEVDALLVGGGIMSATLAVLLKHLDPGLRVMVVEALDHVAGESTEAWNNAGTGHAALCELNYTPEKGAGVDIAKAVQINAQFQLSLSLWSTLVQRGELPDPRAFLNPIPHMSFVTGEKDVEFLRKRYAALKDQPLFAGMAYSEDPAEIAQWVPLMMEGRDPRQRVAATRANFGTDVDFGALTRQFFRWLEQQPGFELRLRTRAAGIHRGEDGCWQVRLQRNIGHGEETAAKFVFLGAGGGALPLLQQSGIAEGRGYGGFPVSGQWLRCTDRELIERHRAKVYGQAAVGAPPMSVPHLDTRVIKGQRELLFGPFAGFSTKFLKKGSFADLPLSVKPNNLGVMVRAGLDNVGLTRYLIGQVMQSHDDRIAALRQFFPKADRNDWVLEIAGQRVQIMKRDEKRGGKLEFGTEVIVAEDRSLAALLGASPGASVAVSAMIGLLERTFAEKIPAFAERLKQLVPVYGEPLATSPEAVNASRDRAAAVLGIGR